MELTIKLGYPCCPFCGARTARGATCTDCESRPRKVAEAKPRKAAKPRPPKKRRIVHPERRVSVWTVSGGLPSLGKRR